MERTRKPRWIVRLGEAEWVRHTYARGPDDDLRLLGSVRRGAQVGALARTRAGEYVQVVGDFVSSLHKGQLVRAMSAATTTQEVYQNSRSAQKTVVAPVIIVKRRRILVAA